MPLENIDGPPGSSAGREYAVSPLLKTRSCLRKLDSYNAQHIFVHKLFRISHCTCACTIWHMLCAHDGANAACCDDGAEVCVSLLP